MGAHHRRYEDVNIKIVINGNEVQIRPENVEAFVFLLSQGRAKAIELGRPHVDLDDDRSKALTSKVEKVKGLVLIIQATIGRARNAVCTLHPGVGKDDVKGKT